MAAERFPSSRSYCYTIGRRINDPCFNCLKEDLILLQQKFFNLQFLPGESMSEFFYRVEDTVSNLKQLGEKLSQTIIITKILMVLQSIYAHFVSAWDYVPVDERTMGNLIARLLMEEERVLSAKKEDSTAFAPARKFNPIKKCLECENTGHLRAQCFRLGLGKNSICCHFCNNLGHIKRDHYQFKRETHKSKDEEMFTVWKSALICDTCNNYTWFLDTGASEHLYCREEPEGIVSVRLLSDTCEGASKIILQNVLFVPEMKINLFSVGSALDKGYTMVSNNHVSKLLNSKGKISAIAERAGSLYKMKFSPHESAVAFVGEKQDLLSWHERMAQDVLNLHVQKMTGGPEVFCKPCIVSKQTRSSFKSSNTKTSRSGEIILTGLCGTTETPSIGGSKYDDYSHFRFVFFLKPKNEVKDKLKFKNQRSEMFKTLCTDCGTEFVNRDMEQLLSELGVVHERSVPYCPEQSGRIEWDIRTMGEAARTMMTGKCLENKFWAEAINTAVYVINRRDTSSVVNKTPYQLWDQDDDNIDLQHEHMLLTQTLSTDSETSKGFCVFPPNENKAIVSCNVKFTPKRNCGEALQRIIGYLNNIERFPNLNEEESNVNTARPSVLTQEENEAGNIEPEEYESVKEKGFVGIRCLRDRDSLRKPKKFDCDFNLLCIIEPDDPATFEEAMNSENSEKWRKAVNQELEN
ncbi:hypothetical protein PR048_018825 [Dryococelus australis]|uniref:Integrase catalytic domain-containing protein n=1 Tax=Dryococelus australis TaxID=614101 RepID=A0ABQ9H1R9_9NEOP|nr:hypothetical protein PR048_018825 [Dryococelus australis]